MEREELIRFLVSRMERELEQAREAAPSPAREACFHRADAYRDVLEQVDQTLARSWALLIVTSKQPPFEVDPSERTL